MSWHKAGADSELADISRDLRRQQHPEETDSAYADSMKSARFILNEDLDLRSARTAVLEQLGEEA